MTKNSLKLFIMCLCLSMVCSCGSLQDSTLLGGVGGGVVGGILGSVIIGNLLGGGDEAKKEFGYGLGYAIGDAICPTDSVQKNVKAK